MDFRNTILDHLKGATENKADSVDLCHACGVQEAELDVAKAQDFGEALEGLEADGLIHWAGGLWHLSHEQHAHGHQMGKAVLDHFLETGASSSRDDIAAKCGVSASTVGKWLKGCGQVPYGCSYELRSRRGGGGGAAKEHFFPRTHMLRDILLRERKAFAHEVGQALARVVKRGREICNGEIGDDGYGGSTLLEQLVKERLLPVPATINAEEIKNLRKHLEDPETWRSPLSLSGE